MICEPGVPMFNGFGIAPPAPYGEFDSGPQGSPYAPPAPNTCCRFRYSSPRFGARVARLKPPRKRSLSLISTFALTLKVNVSAVSL